MNPQWKTRLAAAGATVLAVAIGWWVANGEYAVPVLAFVITGGACLVLMFRLPLDTILLGGLLFGYIVGNRGFAQFSLVPGLPLLPAEAGLALCFGWLAFRCAFSKRLPLQRDTLSIAVLLWIIIGSMRIVQDVRAYGMVALRDFAMTYYAMFFFIAQARMADEPSRRFLRRCLFGATVAVIPMFELFRRFPEFFLSKLVVAGIPLIYFKGDLVATFMAVGVVLTHRRWERTRNPLWVVIAILGIIGVLLSENRASLLGLLVATGWLAVRGHWSMLRTQFVGTVVVSLVLLGAITLGVTWTRNNFVYQVYERIVSMADFSGQRSYMSEQVEFKGENNRFRLVWWEAVVDETVANSPWFGLGFGHDLAASFTRRYYPSSDEDFSTRSPHNILLTVFGRTGVVGLLTFLPMIAAMARYTWQALDRERYHDEGTGYWLAGWVILTCACFGVVLEGPMGAVVFWITLGFANAERTAALSGGEVLAGAEQVETDAVSTLPCLPETASGHQVTDSTLR